MSLWRLIRGEHGILAALASTSSYIIAGGRDPFTALLLAFSTFLAEAGLFAHNDVANLPEDRLNRPNAPLVTGSVSLRTAKTVAYGSLTSGGAAALFLGAAPFLIYLTAASLGVMYNAKLKKRPVVGNLTVAFLTSMTYIYGMAAAGSYSSVLAALFISSLVANLGREWVKTAIDYEGDRAAGLKTLAVAIGPQRTAALGAAMTLTSAAPGALLIYLSFVEGLYIIATGAAATVALLIYYSFIALRGGWERYRNGTLAAFGITLITLVIEALWLLF